MKKGYIWGGIIGLVLILAYSAGIGYYSERFISNTIYAGVEIGGLTLDEAIQKVDTEAQYDSITVNEEGSELVTISYEDILVVNFNEQLTKLYNSQNPTNWIYEGLHGTHSKERLKDVGAVDEESLLNLINQATKAKERKKSQDAYINYTDELGYYVEQAQQGNEINGQEIVEFVKEKRPVLVNSDEFYIKPQVTATDDDIVSHMDLINSILDVQFTYDFTDYKETIPRSMIEDWLEFDGDNNPQLNYDKVTSYLWTLNDTYGTRQKTRQFKSTNKGVVTIQPQIYGWEFDVETEYNQLSQEILSGQSVTREPNIVGRVKVDTLGSDDIGGSYVEIDLAAQHLYLYKDYTLVLETSVVTGMPPIMETIPGAWFILYKETNATLRGYNPHYDRDYATPVDYWVPFDNGGMGVHDANWQANFGGNVYQTAGSNGCINMPPNLMPTFFDYVEEGMPVIIY